MALGMRGVLSPWGLATTSKHSPPRCSQSFSALPALKTQPADEEELALFRHYREKRYNGNKPGNRRSLQVEPRFHVETLRQNEVAVRVTTCPSIERIGASVSVRPLKPIIHTSKTEEHVEDGPVRESQSHSPSPAFMQNFPRRKFPQWDSSKFSTGVEAQILVSNGLPDQATEVDVNGSGTDVTFAAAPAVEKPLKKPKKVRAPAEPIEKESFPTNDDILVVDNEETARKVVELLMGKYKDEVHACDTEVADIDVKKESPVGHGYMICFSVYCGPTADFGEGKSQLWVDVLQGGKLVVDIFKAYFEDESIKKVWHNYSFDAHILGNHGIKAAGFYADTMHLARLWDSARGAYSLEALSSDPNVADGLPRGHFGNGKTSMKELFARNNIKKDGTEGKLKVIPPLEELQTTVDTRGKWIHYSAYDAVCTWHVWDSLKKKLKNAAWYMDMIKRGSMYDFYEMYWRQFGQLLVQMEAEGMLVERGHLAEVEKIALSQKRLSVSRFQKWASNYCPDALYMNVCSDAQIRQLLFGGVTNRKDSTEFYPQERSFKVPNTENFMEPGAKAPKKYRTITLRGIGVKIPADVYTPSGWPAVSGPVLKALAGNVAVDYEEEVDEPDFPIDSERVLTSEGVVGSDGENKEEDLSVYGKAFAAFNGGEPGKKACMAFAALCELTSIDTLISNFIQPLQNGQIMGADGRVHCSLNINTETGRLSARRPNLQNQPALEKDRYKIRHAFVASPGKSLIVADYGQLELRILAHLTGCRSMLEAFKAGGDFHSRTALNMYPHVRQAVDEGKVLLEWDPKPGETKPPVPLLKDLFGSERRKAKMLNFSIAYGKTAKGLAKDWKVSVTEAQNTLDLWYNDRMEVKDWQLQTIDMARVTKRVHTLLGRSRHLPDITSPNTYLRSHLERAAINTPVQGSAADVAMCAMLEINRNVRLRELGWKLILQVHDEVILEGPSESCEEAKELVVKCMSFPFNGENFLQVGLDVDADYARSWYEAK